MLGALLNWLQEEYRNWYDMNDEVVGASVPFMSRQAVEKEANI
jgi:hypothetical protein